MIKRFRPSCLLLWLASLWVWTTPAIPESATVDVALALAVDVSYSVDDYEHLLQMRGFAAALQSEEVMQAVHNGRHGRVAVMVYQWSDEDKQVVIIPWTIISATAEAEAVAAILTKAERKAGHGGTAISAALAFGARLLDAAPPADRRVIDLATDGRNNLGRPTREARDAVLAKGITINGLAIRNEWKQLAAYLESQVIGGSLSFVEEAASYDDFGAAMLRKLVREISGSGIT